jgi:putative PEP-CTERM system TPR-repeat lipoprotein
MGQDNGVRGRVRAWSVGVVAAAAMLSTGCLGPSVERRIAASELALVRDDTATAAIEAKNLLKDKPELAAGRLQLARVLLASGDAAGTDTELKRAQSFGATEAELAPVQAALWMAQSRPDEVIERFAAVRFEDRPRETADLRVEVARAQLQRGDRAAALASVQQALAAVPGHVGATVLGATLKAESGDRPAAAQVLQALVAGLAAGAPEASGASTRGVVAELAAARRQADSARALAALAEFEAEDPATAMQATEHWRQALALQPRFAAAHLGVISHALRQRDLAGATTLHQAMKKAMPQHAMTMYFEAVLAYMGNDLPRARELTDTLVSRIDGHAPVLLLAGMTQARVGGLAQAESHLQRAISLQPDWADPRLELASLLLRSGRPERVLELVQPLLGSAAPVPRVSSTSALAGSNAPAATPSGDPDPRALGLAAQALARLGRFAEADAAFARAAANNPGDLSLRTAAAKSQIAQGRVELGLKELQAAADADPEGSAADLALIAAQMKRGDRAAAARALSAFEAKQPKSALPALLRGQMAESAGDRAAARNAYATALERDPSSLQAVAALAALDLVAGDAAAAGERWQALAKRSPNVPAPHLALGELAIREGAAPAVVRDHIDRAVQAAPQDSANWRAAIDLQRRASDPAAVLVRAQAAIAAMPEEPSLLLDLAGAQLQTGDMQSAIVTLRRVSQLRPQDAEGHLRLALAQIGNGQVAAGKPALNRAAELAPMWPAVRRAQIAVAVAEGETERALAVARDVQKLAPTQALGWQLEGEVELTRTRRDAALAAFRTALARQASTDTAIQLHRTLLGTASMPGDAAAAAAFEATWLKGQPRDALFLAYLGEAAKRAGRLPEAESRYRQALALQADDPVVLNNLAYLLIENGRADEGLRLAQRAQTLAPHLPAVLDTLATALGKLGRFKDAVAWQRRAVERQPHDEVLRLHLANLLVAAGQKDPARDELRAIVRGLGSKRPPGESPVQRSAQEALTAIGG